MESVTIREIQHNLSAYLRRVERGEIIEIRRRNTVIAQLVPAKEAAARDEVDWSGVRERRQALWSGKAPGKSISEIVYESREE